MIRERPPYHHRIRRRISPRHNRRRQGRRLFPGLERRVSMLPPRCTTPSLQQAELLPYQWRRSLITPCHLRPLRRQARIPMRDPPPQMLSESRPRTIRDRPTIAPFGLRRTGEAHSGSHNRSGLQLRPSPQRLRARWLGEMLPVRTRLPPRRPKRFTRTPLRRGRLLSSPGASRLRSTLGNRLLTRVSITGRLNLPSLALRRHLRHMLSRLCLPT